MNSNTISNIVIIEDNLELKDSLIYSIESTGKYKVLNTYTSGEEAVIDISQNIPQYIIMDIDLKGKMDGIECTALIKKKYPQIDVLILTVFDDSERVFDALKAGASGYMTKTAALDDVINALEQTAKGGAPMSYKIAKLVLNSFSKNLNSPFTDKENKVINLLAKGGSYKSVANELEVSVETVKYHIKNIYIKLQVNNKEDAIELSRKNNWI